MSNDAPTSSLLIYLDLILTYMMIGVRAYWEYSEVSVRYWQSSQALVTNAPSPIPFTLDGGVSGR